MTLQELQAQRDELVGVLNGTKQASIEGRSVTYNDPSEIRQAIQQLDAEIARLQSPQNNRVFVIQSSRGIQ